MKKHLTLFECHNSHITHKTFLWKKKQKKNVKIVYYHAVTVTATAAE